MDTGRSQGLSGPGAEYATGIPLIWWCTRLTHEFYLATPSALRILMTCHRQQNCRRIPSAQIDRIACR